MISRQTSTAPSFLYRHHGYQSSHRSGNAADILAVIDTYACAGVHGVVQLLPKSYTPPGQIELKRGEVLLCGGGLVNIRAPKSYSWISAQNVSLDNSLIGWRQNAKPDSVSSDQFTTSSSTAFRG